MPERVKEGFIEEASEQNLEWWIQVPPGRPGKKGIQSERKECLKHRVKRLSEILDHQRPSFQGKEVEFYFEDSGEISKRF